MKVSDKKIRGYALKNAIAYKGKAAQGAIVSALFAEGIKKEDMKTYGKKISEIIKEVNVMDVDDQKAAYEKVKDSLSEREVREGLPELPNAEKGVVMRIAPSPSGPLHLMHAINISLNFLYVEKYGGKLYVRIEDTNPENIYPKAYKMIEKESAWLTDKKSIIVIQSDRMEIYYKYAEKLIKGENAYVCTCSGDDFREFVKKQKECPCRELNVKENIQRWNEMFDKKGFKAGEVVLRFKADMSHKNPAMRDFPLARVNDSPHPRQKSKYRVWPLMNLAVSVDDIEEKMTHIIRGKDHRDNAERQKLIFAALGKTYPWNAFTGMTNFTDMKFSTRQMRKDIEEGKVSGWDAPELPTVASLKKRGYKPIAFRGMAEHTGNLSEVDKVIDKKDFFTKLDEFNKL